MAKLNVSAIAEDTLAAPGNAGECYLVVSVTDANGAGVSGLGVTNFALGNEVVAPTGVKSMISAVNVGKNAGIYILNVVPVPTMTWKAGVYVFSLNVTVPTTLSIDKGQVLCSVLMD